MMRETKGENPEIGLAGHRSRRQYGPDGSSPQIRACLSYLVPNRNPHQARFPSFVASDNLRPSRLVRACESNVECADYIIQSRRTPIEGL